MASKEPINELLHSIIEKNKTDKKISLKKLSKVIGYSDVGIMQAIKGRRLSHDDIILLGKEFGFVDELKEAGLKIKNSDLNGKFVDTDGIEYLERKVIDQWDELKKRKAFNMKLDLEIKDELIIHLTKLLKGS